MAAPLAKMWVASRVVPLARSVGSRVAKKAAHWAVLTAVLTVVM